MKDINLAIAPIAWTNDDLPELGKDNTFEQCISEMALAGYKGSEVGNKYPKNAKVLNKYLDIRGLQICNAWYSTFCVTQDFEEYKQDFINHITFIKACGAKVVGVSEQSNSIQGKQVPIFDAKPTFTAEEWEKLCEGYNKLANLAAEYGMKFCVHHHMGTAIQTVVEVEYMLSNTNDNVGLLLDTGHFYYSEGTQEAALHMIDKYFDRIFHVHLKDVRDEEVVKVMSDKLSFLDGVFNGTFTVPGDGVIDFEPIMEKLLSRGYDGWFVVEAEQNPAVANPFEQAVKAKKYIDKLLGGM